MNTAFIKTYFVMSVLAVVAASGVIIASDYAPAGAGSGVCGEVSDALLSAAKAGDVEAFMTMLDGVDVSAVVDNSGYTPLHIAALGDCVAVVQALLKRGANVDAKTKLEVTPLHCAVGTGNLEVVNMLLASGADVNAFFIFCVATGECYSPLILAIEKGYIKVAMALLDGRAIPDAFFRSQRPLVLAVRKNCIQIVRALLNRGADVNVANDGPIYYALKENYSEVADLLMAYKRRVAESTEGSGADHEGVVAADDALCIAAVDGDTGFLLTLLDRGMDINKKSGSYSAPLVGAARSGHVATVRALLGRGAIVDVKTAYDQTSLGVAAEYGHTKVVRLLLDHGADIKNRDQSGHTALMRAIESGHGEIVELLLDRGAGVNEIDDHGFIPLHVAAGKKDITIVRALLDRDSAVNQVDGFVARTALHYAAQSGHFEIIRLLLDRGAEINKSDLRGDTPLHLAVGAGNIKAIQVLLERGANPNVKNGEDHNPLFYAQHNPPAADLLRTYGAEEESACSLM